MLSNIVIACYTVSSPGNSKPQTPSKFGGKAEGYCNITRMRHMIKTVLRKLHWFPVQFGI